MAPLQTVRGCDSGMKLRGAAVSVAPPCSADVLHAGRDVLLHQTHFDTWRPLLTVCAHTSCTQAPSLAGTVSRRSRAVVVRAQGDGDRKRVDWDREWTR